MTGQFSRRDLLRAGAAGLAVATAGCSALPGGSSGRWRYDAGFGTVGPPAVGDGTVYVGAEDKAVHAVDAATGDRAWRYETGGSCARPIAVRESGNRADGNTAYVESEDATLYALRDGGARWRFETHTVAERPVLADGTVYLPDQAYADGRDRGRLYALDARTGERLWTFRTPREFLTLSAVAGDTVVCTDRQVGPTVDGRRSRLYAVDAADGTQRWAVETAGGFVAAARAGGAVAALARRHEVSDDGRDVAEDELRVFDVDTGTQRWARTVGTDGTGVLRVTDRSVYAGVDGAFVARDVATGAVRWRVEGFSGHGPDSYQVVDGTVYLAARADGADPGSVVAVAAADGSTRWQRSFDDLEAVDRVSVAGDTVYAARSGSPETVVAVRAATGERRATHTVENASAWTATPDGVYVGTHDGSLVAFA